MIIQGMAAKPGLPSSWLKLAHSLKCACLSWCAKAEWTAKAACLGNTKGAIMASYPKQPQLPHSLLRANGLFTELVSTSSSSVRRFHPLEWTAALGWPHMLQLPATLENAWHQLGNTLSPQQALFGLCAALSTPNQTYDFQSIVHVLKRDALDLTRTPFSVVDRRLILFTWLDDWASTGTCKDHSVYSVDTAASVLPRKRGAQISSQQLRQLRNGWANMLLFFSYLANG